ncbi:MAG: hypothetical protein L3J56_11575 [Bacteroidales bacterium]|nr:hypothetical protein [Bacteroidales bacterium]
MKKYISFILLIIIVFVSNESYLYFKYLQHNIHQEIKQEIRKGLDEKDLTLIIVSSGNEKEIIWTKKNKEFKYKGLMYDIVKTKIKNKKNYYYCINDIKEKQLITSFSKNNRRRKRTLLKIKKVLNNKYFFEKYSFKTTISKSDIYFCERQQFYNSQTLEVISPPPKFNFNT